MPTPAHLKLKYRDNAPPWPFVRATTAAHALGVTAKYMVGLANNPIPAHKVITARGKYVVLFKKEAIEDLLVKVGKPIPWRVEPRTQ